MLSVIVWQLNKGYNPLEKWQEKFSNFVASKKSENPA